MIGTIGVCFFPESPKYLVKSGKLVQAQETFAMIARYNGASPELVTNERIEAIFKAEDTQQISMIETESETRSSYSVTVENIHANSSTEATSIVKKALKLDNLSDI